MTRRQIEGKKGDVVESKGQLVRELDGQGNAIAGSTGDSGRDSGDSNNKKETQGRQAATDSNKGDKGDRFRQTVDKIPSEIGRQSTRFRQRSVRFRQRSVTMVTITKESPRATGRDNNNDKYCDKNKGRK